MMADKPPEFWNLDLTKLTWSGWLLILMAVGTVIGVALPLLGLMVAWFADRSNAAPPPLPRWMGAIAVVTGLGAGSAVFELGRRLLARAGFPITRSDKP